MNDPLEFEITVKTARDLVRAGDAALLDCREPGEWEVARIDPSVTIPLGEIPSRIGELAGLRDSRMIVFCHHGVRSLMVTEWLRQQGFANVQSMAGGIDAWSVEIDPTVPRY